MTATDDDKEFAAELGFMTALADAALESLGRRPRLSERDFQVRLDAAYFGTTSANGPDGIGNLENVQDVDAGLASPI